MNDCTAEVFISFRFGESHAEALALKAALEARGVKTFLSNVDLGDNLQRVIALALHSCRLVVILCSHTYGTPTNGLFDTGAEMNFVISQKKPYCLVRMIPFDANWALPEVTMAFPPSIMQSLWLPADPMPADLVDQILTKLTKLIASESELVLANQPVPKPSAPVALSDSLKVLSLDVQKPVQSTPQRLTHFPLVRPPTEELLEASNKRRAKAKAKRAGKTEIAQIFATVMTITVEGSLHGPPPFDTGAFKAKLAQKLDMHSEQFVVKKLQSRNGRSRHEVQTSSAVFITVDVDEEGYLRHESSSSESSSGDSELSSEDKDVVAGGISHAIWRALKPHRVASDAIQILWTEEGSVILGVMLDLPYALRLLDLAWSGRGGLQDELRIRSCVVGGEHLPPGPHPVTTDELEEPSNRGTKRGLGSSACSFSWLAKHATPIPVYQPIVMTADEELAKAKGKGDPPDPISAKGKGDLMAAEEALEKAKGVPSDPTPLHGKSFELRSMQFELAPSDDSDDK